MRSRWSPTAPSSCERTSWLIVTTIDVPVMIAPMNAEKIQWFALVLATTVRRGLNPMVLNPTSAA